MWHDQEQSALRNKKSNIKCLSRAPRKALDLGPWTQEKFLILLYMQLNNRDFIKSTMFSLEKTVANIGSYQNKTLD
jgi:hypothetical protein